MNESARGPVDLNLFRVFDAVYRSGSITRAAGLLRLTQPAVSNALTRLRAHFDDPLFVREGRRVVPTPFARGLADDVSRALASLGDAVRRGRAFDPATSTRRFVIAMRDATEFALLPPLVRELQRHGRGLQVWSTRLERSRLGRQLAQGELDFAVDLPLAVGDEVRQAELLRADLFVAMRTKHPLAARPLTIERWLGARHVVVSARPNGPVLEDLALQQQGLVRQVAVRCQHYYAACEVVAASDLLLTLPRYGGDWIRSRLPLHFARTPLGIGPLPITLYWHHTAEEDPGNLWFRDLLRRLCRPLVRRARRRAAAPWRGFT
jgi:DNA-binding transcriptional LysR family regulator